MKSGSNWSKKQLRKNSVNRDLRSKREGSGGEVVYMKCCKSEDALLERSRISGIVLCRSGGG